jgi:DNA polymerase-3 subunit gamma/tau
MSYVVLARRYRPQTLEQVIGQEHISRTLENAIEENRVAHAYLFSGPRGVGKTTTARILAKALNCKNGPTPAPCGECVNCEEIAAGSSVDVQEIDGASNRGIDEIRALRENVKFAPASSKYKIYIIDEAHQITDAAFNALLKTLEEPPDHVVFILATTEPQKIPVTILSRCQRYRFRLLSAKEVYSTLERIIQKEGFEIEPAALQIIVSSAGGSLRDALSLLDQAISFVSGKVTHKDIQNLLGFLPKEIICSFTEALSRADSAEILSIIKEVTEQGYNLLQFCRDLREHLRSLLLFKLNPAILEITDDDKRVLANQKDAWSRSPTST